MKLIGKHFSKQFCVEMKIYKTECKDYKIEFDGDFQDAQYVKTLKEALEIVNNMK